MRLSKHISDLYSKHNKDDVDAYVKSKGWDKLFQDGSQKQGLSQQGKGLSTSPTNQGMPTGEGRGVRDEQRGMPTKGQPAVKSKKPTMSSYYDKRDKGMKVTSVRKGGHNNQQGLWLKDDTGNIRFVGEKAGGAAGKLYAKYVDKAGSFVDDREASGNSIRLSGDKAPQVQQQAEQGGLDTRGIPKWDGNPQVVANAKDIAPFTGDESQEPQTDPQTQGVPAQPPPGKLPGWVDVKQAAPAVVDQEKAGDLDKIYDEQAPSFQGLRPLQKAGSRAGTGTRSGKQFDIRGQDRIIIDNVLKSGMGRDELFDVATGDRTEKGELYLQHFQKLSREYPDTPPERIQVRAIELSGLRDEKGIAQDRVKQLEQQNIDEEGHIRPEVFGWESGEFKDRAEEAAELRKTHGLPTAKEEKTAKRKAALKKIATFDNMRKLSTAMTNGDSADKKEAAKNVKRLVDADDKAYSVPLLDFYMGHTGKSLKKVFGNKEVKKAVSKLGEEFDAPTVSEKVIRKLITRGNKDKSVEKSYEYRLKKILADKFFKKSFFKLQGKGVKDMVNDILEKELKSRDTTLGSEPAALLKSK